MSDRLGAVFAALSDPSRRLMLERLLSDGSISVPELSEQLPISRQAVAKHLASLQSAGLVERAPGDGREVRYELRPGALAPAAAWVERTERGWDRRLARLRRAAESSGRSRGRDGEP